MHNLEENEYYKVFDDKNTTCQGVAFKEGVIYTAKGRIIPCKNGFHACKNIIDCFNYKRFHLSMRVFIVSLQGKTITEGDKTVGQKMTLIREVPIWEVDELVNKGDYNIGYGNEGDSNKGNWNKGNWNEGNWNVGDSNEGDWNKGNKNEGDSNEGNWNKGNWNKGNWNEGNWNVGDNNNKRNNNKGE